MSGLRTTASTLLNEMGRWNSDAIERQLAHQEEDEVRYAYMHAAGFWNERVEMMQVWADYLNPLKSGAVVIRLPAARQIRMGPPIYPGGV